MIQNDYLNSPTLFIFSDCSSPDSLRPFLLLVLSPSANHNCSAIIRLDFLLTSLVVDHYVV